MKVIISKRILIVVLSIVFIMILALGSVYVFRKTSTYGNYQSIMDNCVKESKGLKSTVTCQAILYKSDIGNNGTICFGLDVITKDYRLENLEVCESEETINWDSSIMKQTTRKIPVNISMTFNKTIFDIYRLKNLSLELINDQDIALMLVKLGDNGIQIENVYTRMAKEIEDKGFYVSRGVDISEEKNTGRVIFYEGTIKEISVDGDWINLSFKIRIFDSEYEISTRVKGFKYEDFGDVKTFDHSNVNEFKTDGKYQIGFLYFPQNSDISDMEIESYCNNEIFRIDYLCEILSSRAVSSLVVDDAYSYVQNIVTNSNNKVITFDKFIFDYLFLKL